MARTYPKITVKAYIRVNGQRVDVDTLNPAQRSYLGACLQVQMLNAAYGGQARFWADLPPKEEVFPPDAQYGVADQTQKENPHRCGNTDRGERNEPLQHDYCSTS